jgi:RNA polymerase sigma-70 factor, ECF subfamily
MSILRQREDAENVVQTAFLKMVESLDGFREESAFGTWITRVATNGALNVLRKRKGLPTVSLDGSQSSREEGDIPHPDTIADWRGDPARIVETRELRRILDDAIDGLPENHRLVFVLRDVEGMSVKETAAALGISEANVKVRLLRARLALREVLTRVFGDESRRVVAAHDHDGHDHDHHDHDGGEAGGNGGGQDGGRGNGGGRERGGRDGSGARSTPAEVVLEDYESR